MTIFMSAVLKWNSLLSEMLRLSSSSEIRSSLLSLQAVSSLSTLPDFPPSSIAIIGAKKNKQKYSVIISNISTLLKVIVLFKMFSYVLNFTCLLVLFSTWLLSPIKLSMKISPLQKFFLRPRFFFFFGRIHPLSKLVCPPGGLPGLRFFFLPK